MSIFFSNPRSLIKFNFDRKISSFFSFLIFFFPISALAWSGYDYENNTTIEIGPGNLVRENLEIKIFDWSTNSYHDVEILIMDESFNGTRLEVKDLETGKKRIFEMEE